MTGGLAVARNENREALDRLYGRLLTELGNGTGGGIVRMITEELGGLRITVPTIRDLEREERDRRIRAMFDGKNHAELSLRFVMSKTQIRRIVSGD